LADCARWVAGTSQARDRAPRFEAREHTLQPRRAHHVDRLRVRSCMLHAACCMLRHVVCCMLHAAACCMLHVARSMLHDGHITLTEFGCATLCSSHRHPMPHGISRAATVACAIPAAPRC
jgi:hypothetical protein